VKGKFGAIDAAFSLTFLQIIEYDVVHSICTQGEWPSAKATPIRQSNNKNEASCRPWSLPFCV